MLYILYQHACSIVAAGRSATPFETVRAKQRVELPRYYSPLSSIIHTYLQLYTAIRMPGCCLWYPIAACSAGAVKLRLSRLACPTTSTVRLWEAYNKSRYILRSSCTSFYGPIAFLRKSSHLFKCSVNNSDFLRKVYLPLLNEKSRHNPKSLTGLEIRAVIQSLSISRSRTPTYIRTHLIRGV